MRALVLMLVLAAPAVAGCAFTGVSPAPSGAKADDPVLQLGRTVFQAHCARCHGASGGGGAGPKLSGGTVVKHFADQNAQADVVRNGRGSMPAWKGALSDAEIQAVVRYTREVL